MKKKALVLGTVAMSLLTLSACGDDNKNENTETQREQELAIINQIDEEDNVDYNSGNSTAWSNYMAVVGNLLKTDATTLYNYWTVSYRGGKSYAEQFKNHEISSLTSGLACVEQIIDGMADIANEVGEAKIGDPLSKYMTNFPNKNNMREGLYAVESWYSWHSRLDYSNNILSIRNAYYGIYDKNINNMTEKPAANSMYNTVQAINPTLNTNIINAINAAIQAIQAIPQPFRSNINTTESRTAQIACDNLEQILSNDLKSFFQNNVATNEVCDPIIANIVDNVIVPTSKDLKELNETLYNKIIAFQKNPTTAGFATLGDAWIASRQPWETFEAFLFGPVSDDGLDPNMDSWPLDRDGIVNLLNSQNWNDMNWSGEFDEDSEAIAAAQGLRGFHTLEFLIFKNGKTRTVQ